MRASMDILVVAAILAASLLHASWHALVKSTGDRVLALAGMNTVSAATALMLLPLAKPLPVPAYGVIAGSVLLHVGYKLALARLYDRADLGQAYPLARGLTPLMAALLGFAVLGEAPGLAGAAGIALVCAGLVLLAFEGGRRLTVAAFALAAGAGLAVAGYSVVDAYGIRLAGDWLSFTIWLVLLDGAAFVLYALATRRAAALRSWAAAPGRTLASGVLGVISFGVFMWALGQAPVGQVSALRETSVLFAALIGALFLGERANWQRYAAAAAVATGVGVIALAN
jgi:drug/metabolite transporter (DMT)-like permease